MKLKFFCIHLFLGLLVCARCLLMNRKVERMLVFTIEFQVDCIDKYFPVFKTHLNITAYSVLIVYLLNPESEKIPNKDYLYLY